MCMLMAVKPFSALADDDETYKYDFGVGVGMSGYLGDCNRSNFLRNPGVAAQLMMHFLLDERWSIRTNLSYASLSGNSANFSDYFPEGITYSFKSNVFDLGAQAEFNFLNYGIGHTYRRLHRWTPYLTLGAGVTMAQVVDGKSCFALTIPMGGGVKFKLRERLNLGFEFTMRKVFGDRIDGFDLGEIKGIKSSFGKNSDWYSMMIFTITYEFGKRCKVCHYVE